MRLRLRLIDSCLVVLAAALGACSAQDGSQAAQLASTLTPTTTA